MWSGAVTDTEHAQRSYFTVAQLSVPLSKGFGHGVEINFIENPRVFRQALYQAVIKLLSR